MSRRRSLPRFLRQGALALAALALVAGCQRPATEEPAPPGGESPPLVIGAVFPLSAGAGRIGEMKRQGADLAVQHLNAPLSGEVGVGGRPLAIEYVDSKNDSTQALTGFSKLVDVDKVPVVMSAMSQISLALVPVADRNQVVLFANASHPELTSQSPFVFRNMPSTEQNAKAMAETAYRELGVRRPAILYLNDEYGKEAARVFERVFSSLGGEIVAVDSFDRAGTDFRSQLAKLAGAEPDAWWIPGYGPALGLVLKQMGEMQVPGQVLCDLGLVDDDVLDTAGAAADRSVVVVPAFDPGDESERVQRFVLDFEKEYQESPSFDAAFQYDAVFLIADALKRASEPTGPALRDALAATRDFVGVCGPYTFDADGDAQMPVVVKLLADGRLMPLERIGDVPRGSPADTAPTDEAGQE